MSVLWLLVGASIVVALAFLIVFIWAVRSGQYDDNYTPSVRILFEDHKKISHIDPASPPTKPEGSNAHGDANRQVRQYDRP